MQELTTDSMTQLRASQTEYDSATNHKMYQFVVIHGLCGIGP